VADIVQVFANPEYRKQKTETEYRIQYPVLGLLVTASEIEESPYARDLGG
jgi:hypothetical protein